MSTDDRTEHGTGNPGKGQSDSAALAACIYIVLVYSVQTTIHLPTNVAWSDWYAWHSIDTRQHSIICVYSSDFVLAMS